MPATNCNIAVDQSVQILYGKPIAGYSNRNDVSEKKFHDREGESRVSGMRSIQINKVANIHDIDRAKVYQSTELIH